MGWNSRSRTRARRGTDLQTRTFRLATSLAVMAFLAGCQTSGTSGGLFGGGKKVADNAPPPPASAEQIVRGTCPKVQLRDGTAFYQTYAGGGKKDKDPSKVVTQFALDQTTRQCLFTGSQVVMQIAAAGRVLSGPAGHPGPVVMPIRVAVVNADGKVVYSQLTKFPAEIPPGSQTNQFLFKKDVPISVDDAQTAQVYVGFDPGPSKSR